MRILFLIFAVFVGCSTVDRLLLKKHGSGYEPKPGLAQTIGTISAINDASAPVNPFFPIVSGVLGIATFALGEYARRRSAASAMHEGHAKTMAQVIEHHLPNEVSATVKKAVENLAMKKGQANSLDSFVQNVSRNL